MNKIVEERFLSVIHNQLKGLSNKVSDDFSFENFANELNSLKEDFIFSSFSLDVPEYALIRFMGRANISVGRRFGHIYERALQEAVAERFDLSLSDIITKYEKLGLDMEINLSKIKNPKNVIHIKKTCAKFFTQPLDKGLGVEIRYRFSPNDSSRINKDIKMGQLLAEQGLTPIYIVLSSDVQRDKDAIPKLERDGRWKFLKGNEAMSLSAN